VKKEGDSAGQEDDQREGKEQAAVSHYFNAEEGQVAKDGATGGSNR